MDSSSSENALEKWSTTSSFYLIFCGAKNLPTANSSLESGKFFICSKGLLKTERGRQSWRSFLYTNWCFSWQMTGASTTFWVVLHLHVFNFLALKSPRSNAASSIGTKIQFHIKRQNLVPFFKRAYRYVVFLGAHLSFVKKPLWRLSSYKDGWKARNCW